jgi:hypothetical protein
MIIKIKKNWKDFAEKCNHPEGLSRRDFLGRGMATGAMTVLLPKLLGGRLIYEALGGQVNCPPATRVTGGIAQIFSEGGPTMGARLLGEQQAQSMNATMAANYGISGNLEKLGLNVYVDRTSPFGAALLQGPNGYTGGAAAWRTNVLNKLSLGGHLGPFNADDGAGQNLGNFGAVTPFKSSQMGKDLLLGVGSNQSKWAEGLPASRIIGAPAALTKEKLFGTFSMTPPAAGFVTKDTLNKASTAATGLAQIFSSLFQNDGRKGAASLEAISCNFPGNADLADPNYGSSLFTATNITALTSKMTVANMSPSEQAQLAAFYQSAMGVAGGVLLEYNGRDYHAQDPATRITPADIEEARSVVMFLAACEAAQSRGALIYVSNGQAIANGVQANVTATINGTAVTVNAPVASADAGGAYNGGFILFYDPKGSPPAAKMTGTLNTTNGNVAASGQVGSVPEAVAGLYLSALYWTLGGTLPQSALDAMRKAGVASNPTNIMVF